MAFKLIVNSDPHGTFERSVTLEELEEFNLELEYAIDGGSEPAVLDLGEGFRLEVTEET